jgi:hypothetical protein
VSSRRNIVVTHLIGGLGNQMFQYAAGMGIAKATGFLLKVDTSDFTSSQQRKLELNGIVRDLIELPQSELIHWKQRREKESKRLRQVFRRFTGLQEFPWAPFFQRYTVLHERSSSNMPLYTPGFFVQHKHDIYLDGYWQSSRYFSNATEELSLSLNVTKVLHGAWKKLYEDIRSQDATVIHIRRGDYVSNPDFTRLYGCLPVSYYNRSIETIDRMRGRETRLFIISDDPNWVAQNIFAFRRSGTVIDTTGEHSAVGIALMSAAKNNVIANSSYSWWAAWLNSHADKIVIGPEKWFAGDGFDSRKILEKEWIVEKGGEK